MTASDVLERLTPDVVAALSGWGEGAIDEALAAGMTAEEAVRRIVSAVDSAPYSGWANKLFQTFGGGSHYPELNLLQALGLQPPDVIPDEMKGVPARNATDALALAAKGRHWNGTQAFTDPAELDARRSGLDRYPAEYEAIDPHLRYVAIMTGLLPTGPRRFGDPAPSNLRDFLDRTLQSWLDMQWALKEGRPVPTTGVAGPIRKGPRP